MKPHWTNVKTVFETLSYIVKNYSPDGVGLHSTRSPITSRNKKTSELLKVVDEAKVEGKTFIKHRLNMLLGEEYGKAMAASPDSAKRIMPLSLYILTDGVWLPECSADDPFIHLVDQLIKFKLGSSQVAVQFIRFGSDPKGLQRLNHLNSELKLKMYLSHQISNCVNAHMLDFIGTSSIPLHRMEAS
jgi:hypothetical protein